MRLIIDTHTHTVASSHAYSTILENVEYAKKNKLKAVCITDHAHGMPGGAHSWFFWNLQNIPMNINGIKVFKGVEANILNDKGELDIEEKFNDYKDLQLVIASIHSTFIKSMGKEYCTNLYVNSIKNPHINIIGHPDDIIYEYEIETVVKAAKEYNTAIELNNASFKMGRGNKEFMCNVLKCCKENGVYIACASDAHFATDIGNFKLISHMLKEVEFPEALVLNTSIEKLENFLEKN